MPVPRNGGHLTPEGIAMAITIFADNQTLSRFAGGTAAMLVDRWTLTGISPCCACTCDGRVDL
ncbi:MAG TPA: hypothetical protein VD789_07730 [Thermomicrobiales bacterium]|nr:hypothetical protein [Thermomicrobiales bacterium]